MIQPILINLHPNDCSQEFRYYPFSVKLDRRAGSCNTLNDLSNKVWVPNKTEDLNLNVFNIITGEPLNRARQQSIYDANVIIDLMEKNIIQINGWLTISVNVSEKKFMYVEKIMFPILLHVSVKMENI